jgi:hypothetical protein
MIYKNLTELIIDSARESLYESLYELLKIISAKFLITGHKSRKKSHWWGEGQKKIALVGGTGGAGPDPPPLYQVRVYCESAIPFLCNTLFVQ